MVKKKTNINIKSSTSNKKMIQKQVKVKPKQNPNKLQQQQLQDIEDSNNDQQQNLNSISSPNQDDDEQDSSQDDDDDEDSNQEDSQQSSSITPVKPENYAIKQIQFRQRRGTKMNYLMSRKKQQQQDPFWAEHKGYFGDLNAEDDEDQEDYVESSQGKDQFDSDFGQTQSQHDDAEQGQNENKIVDQNDEQKLKEKKRRAQLMKKVNAYKEKQKPQKTQKPKIQIKQQRRQIKAEAPIKKQKSQPKIPQEVGNRFIHQMFTQEQLLGQAAHTQYYNWLSLKKLISIETEKKDFTKKQKHIDGNKIIYRDKLLENGSRQVSYQLHGVTVKEVEDLSKIWQNK